jgi:hypothetical protein
VRAREPTRGVAHGELAEEGHEDLATRLRHELGELGRRHQSAKQHAPQTSSGCFVSKRGALSPAVAATLFYDAALGAKEDAAVTPAAYRRQLRRLVSVLARGLGAR